MLLHLFLFCVSALLYFARKRLRTQISGLVIVGIVALFLISSVATLGLLSVTFVVVPIIALYLMLLGHRKSAYASIIAIFIYLLIIGFLFTSGRIDPIVSPDGYVRSAIAWMLMIVVVVGVSIGFVAPFELIPGVLEGSEERFRLAFENANVGIFLAGLEGRILKVNDALCKMLGYSSQELEQMNISDITYRDDKDVTLNYIPWQQIGGIEKANLQKRYLHKRGDVIWADVSSSLIRDSEHNPQCFITNVRNITESKQAEERLKQAVEWQEAIFEGSRDSIFISDHDSRFVAVNNAACELTGYSREQLLKMRIPDLHDKPDLVAYKTYNQKIFDGEEIVSEAKILRRDGSKVDAEFNNRRVSIAGVFYMHTTARDITERKRAEAALIESETKFRSVFENIHDVYFETTLDGTIIEISPSIELISKGQYTRDDLLGKPFIGFYRNPEMRAIFINSLKEHMRVSDFELTLKNRDGSLVECSISAKLQKSTDANIEIISGTIRDITERKLAEEALRESETRFQQLSDATLEGIAISDKGMLVDGNTRLATMLGYTLAEMIGRPVTDFIAPESQSVELESIGENIGKEYEHSLLRKDGSTIAVESNARLTMWNGKMMRVTVIRDLTERKQAELALRASESQFRDLWESTVEGIAIHDKGIILEINEAMCQLFRVGREQAIGKSLLDFAPKEMHAALREHIDSAEGGRFETPALRPNGTRLILEVFSKQTLYRGKIAQMAAVRDITERKQAEEALHESEERYQSITEAITDYIYTVRVVDGRAAATSHGLGCTAVTGYQPDEFANNPYLWLNMVMAEDRPKVEEQAQLVLAGKDPPPVEHRIVHKNGSIRWVRNTFVLHRDQNGAVAAYDGLIQDITERKRAEEALQESEFKYRQLVEGSPDAIAIYVDGKIVFANSAGVALVKASSVEDLIGMPVLDLVHPEYREVITARMKDALSTGKPLPLLEEKFLAFDGSEVDVDVKALPVTYGNKSAVQLIVRDITEKKKAQQALRESQLRYRATVEQSNEGITIADLDGRYIMVNPAYCKMTGYSESELLKMRVVDLMPKQSSLRLFTQIAKNNEAGYREVELERKDGTTFIALITGSSLEIGNDRFVQGIVQDITERKRAEEALRESEERFHNMFEMHDTVMLLIEPVSGQINDANPAAEKFYGYSVNQLCGMFIQDINVMPSGQIAVERSRAVASDKTSFIFSHRLANGDVRIVEVHSSPITLGGKQSLFSIIHDITERKEAEEALRKLSLAVEQSPASIVITDTRGNIEYVNPKFTQVSGYTMEEVRGKNPNILKSGETSPEEYKKLWEAISSGNDWRGEFHNKKKNGELFWEMASISPVKNANNDITNFVAVKEDITERKRAEEALRHAQKLESIGTLAGGIAHDFNNLLNAIMGQSSLALGRLPKESAAGNNIAKALKAAERAATLHGSSLHIPAKGSFLPMISTSTA